MSRQRFPNSPRMVVVQRCCQRRVPRSLDAAVDRPCRKLNTSPATIDDKDALQKKLCHPPIKKIDLHFPLGLEVTARNLKGVTIKDALDAIHKQFKKKVWSDRKPPCFGVRAPCSQPLGG